MISGVLYWVTTFEGGAPECLAMQATSFASHGQYTKSRDQGFSWSKNEAEIERENERLAQAWVYTPAA